MNSPGAGRMLACWPKGVADYGCADAHSQTLMLGNFRIYLRMIRIGAWVARGKQSGVVVFDNDFAAMFIPLGNSKY